METFRHSNKRSRIFVKVSRSSTSPLAQLNPCVLAISRGSQELLATLRALLSELRGERRATGPCPGRCVGLCVYVCVFVCVCVCVIIGRVQVAGSIKQQEQSHFLWCWEQLATPATESLVLAHTEVRPAKCVGVGMT